MLNKTHYKPEARPLRTESFARDLLPQLEHDRNRLRRLSIDELLQDLNAVANAREVCVLGEERELLDAVLR